MNRFIIAALILSLLGVVIWLGSRPDAAPQQMPELIRFHQNEITSMTLTRESGPTLSFMRKGEQWYLSEADKTSTPDIADGEAVEHLLHDLATMEVVRVVTRNPAQYEKLKVTTGSTQVVLNREGESVVDLHIGKQGQDILSTYIRVNAWPEVLAVNKSLLWQVSRSPDGWKAKRSVEAAAEAVSESASETEQKGDE